MTTAIDDWDPPVLGEPVPIELANTRYRDGDELVEFLPHPVTAARWFALSPTAALLPQPHRWTRPAWMRLIELRNTVDELLRARIAGSSPKPVHVACLNELAGLVSGCPELRWRTAREIEQVQRLTARSRTDAVIGTIAVDTINLLAGPGADLLRVCANDDCQMLFLKQHHRRRWCHNSCGHRHRQATYYARGRA